MAQAAGMKQCTERGTRHQQPSIQALRQPAGNYLPCPARCRRATFATAGPGPADHRLSESADSFYIE